MNLLRDPIWQFIGVLFAILTLMASAAKIFLNKSKKIIVLDSETSPLLNANDRELEIIYKGKRLSRVDLTTFSIENVGRVPVLKSDFDHPAWIVVPEMQEIIFVDFTKPGFRIECIEDAGKIGIVPFLLNEGERVQFKVAVAGGWRDVSLDLRLLSATIYDRRAYNLLPSVLLKKTARHLVFSMLPQYIWVLGGAYLGGFLISKFMK